MPPILRYRHPSGVCYRHPSGVWGPPRRLGGYATVWKVTPGDKVNWARDTTSATQLCVSGGAVYVVGGFTGADGRNLFKLQASTGRTIWSKQLGVPNTAAHAICPDGGGGVIVSTAVSTYNLYRLNSDGDIVWNQLEKVGTGNISQFSRMFVSGPYLYAAHTGASFPNNVGLSSFNVSDGTLNLHSTLAANAMNAVTIDPYVGNQLISSNTGASNNVLTSTQSTMAALSFYSTAGFNDLDNDGTDAFGGASTNTYKMNSSYGLAWTASNKGGRAVAVDNTGGVYAGGIRQGSKSVWHLDNSGGLLWDYDTGNQVNDVQFSGTAVYACGTRSNTYATTA